MKFILPLVLIGLANPCWSAIPSKTESSSASSQLALEILSMPEANRKQIGEDKAEELYPELIRISKNEKENMSNRWKALTLAAYLGRDNALEDLNAALKSKDWYMRNAAMIGLNIYHPLKAQAAARVLLKDKALVVRSAAVEILGTDLDQKSRELLWEEMNASYNFRKKQSLWIRKQILSQLSEKPDSKESGYFVNALNEKDQDMQSSAIAALEKLTQTKMGAKETVAKKKELWLQWAKAHPSVANE